MTSPVESSQVDANLSLGDPSSLLHAFFQVAEPAQDITHFHHLMLTPLFPGALQQENAPPRPLLLTGLANSNRVLAVGLSAKLVQAGICRSRNGKSSVRNEHRLDSRPETTTLKQPYFDTLASGQNPLLQQIFRLFPEFVHGSLS